MSAATLPPRKRFTRTEVREMLEAGLFAGQRLELIDGDLIDKMGQNPPHASAIRLFWAWLLKVVSADTILVQLPIEAGAPDRERSEPEPDLAVLAEDKAEYRHRHPRGDELLLVVEVADTTVRYDAGLKRDLYARAGVREYWVLDIPGRQLIVHRSLEQSRFGQITILSEHDSISFASHTIEVAGLLP